MVTEKKYKRTVLSCYLGYTVQAIVNNFAPLLFITFQQAYDIPLSKITLLITLNFGIQLIIDLLATRLVDKIGYKISFLVALGFSSVGLVLLAFLPTVFPSPYIGLLIAVLVSAVGVGLIEVVVSPIMESCPTDNKEKSMSLLHSFYCFGHVGVILLSTLYFAVFGIQNWRYLTLFLALFPIMTFALFLKAPVKTLIPDGEKGMKIKELLLTPVFWLFMLMMTCAGAGEQAVSQWASAFAEEGLGVSKTLGDLLGPTLFALCMGISRFTYGKFAKKLKLSVYMPICAILCTVSYLLITLVPNAVFNLIACGLCGFAIGIAWPGTFSTASKTLPRGGTTLFAFLALAGDIGCTSGPTLVGLVSSYSGNMKFGILSAVVFPALLALSTVLFFLSRKKTKENTIE